MQRVLITGGAGFIGSNYVRYALQHHPEWEITVLDKLTYAGNVDNLRDTRDHIRFMHGDIADAVAVGQAMEGIDTVLNFAAESHVDRSLMDPRPFIRTNIEGTMVLLEAARSVGVKRFLHVSTDEVYGDLVGTTRHSLEIDPLAPRSPYSASKAGAEHLVLAYGISYGVNVVITRGSNTYGPYQYPEKIIPLFIANALEDKPLPVYGDGSAVRDYMHVEDHCGGIDRVLHDGRSGESYNLGARVELTGIKVAQQILDLLDKPSALIQFVTERPGHDYRYAVNPAKSEALGWARKWSFDAGLAETVKWYVEHREWTMRVRERQNYQAFMAAQYRQQNA